jgi:hypothetical protein
MKPLPAIPWQERTQGGIPVVPPLPQGEPNLDPNPVVSKCGECGIEWQRVMHYSCGNSRCPMQPHVTC